MTSKVSKKKKSANYDPVSAASWKAGELVPYAFLADAFARIEATTKRLEITEIATNLFRSVIAVSPNDLLPTVCLVTNQVEPFIESRIMMTPNLILIFGVFSSMPLFSSTNIAILTHIRDTNANARRSHQHLKDWSLE